MLGCGNETDILKFAVSWSVLVITVPGFLEI